MRRSMIIFLKVICCRQISSGLDKSQAVARIGKENTKTDEDMKMNILQSKEDLFGF